MGGMEAAQALLAALMQRNVAVWTDCGRLHFRAPRGVLEPSDLDRMRVLKSELVTLVEQSESAEEQPLVRRPVGCIVPLTFVQRPVFEYLENHCNRLSVRMCTLVTHIHGSLKVHILEQSLTEVVRRHESLRTRFVRVDGVPTQLIDQPYRFELKPIDIPVGADQSEERRALELADEFLYGNLVDISTGPLFAARLYAFSPRQHVLILAQEHLISDGLTMYILHKEIWSAYCQISEAGAVSLPEVLIQLGDYAVWQQSMYGSWLQNHAPYWISRFAGVSGVRIPVRREATPKAEAAKGDRFEFYFGNHLSVQMRELARGERTLLPIVVLTAYAAAVSHWLKISDVIVKLVSHLRDRQELANMIGPTGIDLYLRIEVLAESELRDLLHRVDAEYRSAFEHADFGNLRDVLPGLDTDLYVNFANVDLRKELSETIVSVDGNELHIRAAPFRRPVPFRILACFFIDDPAVGIVGSIEYQSGLYDESTLRQLTDNMIRFADVLAYRGSVRVGSVAMP